MTLHSSTLEPDPQAIAVLLAVLPTKVAGGVLGGLSGQLRSDVALSFALLDHAPPTVIEHSKHVLRHALDSILADNLDGAGGVDRLAEMLMHMDRMAEHSVIDALNAASASLARDVRARMVSFSSVLLLDGRDVQVLLRELEPHTLAIALREATDVERQKFFDNMSKRAADMIQEDMEVMKPRWNDPTPKHAQLMIASLLQRLEEAGKITISYDGDPRADDDR